MAIELVKTEDVVPAAGGATEDFAIGYPSSDMTRICDWNGRVLGTATVRCSWRLVGSYLSDRIYQVDATIGGAEYTGRTMGPNMLWRGRRRRTQWSDTVAGMERRRERRQAMRAKGRV